MSVNNAINENAVSVFNHEQFGEIRTVSVNGEPWFVAKDVAIVLGYANPLEAIRNHCKGVSESRTPSNGGNQMMKIIPESDLYRLILRSNLPQAEAFQDWVVKEVLPSIRKDGAYVVAKAGESEEIIMARGMLAAGKAIERLKAQIAEDAPKVQLANDFLELGRNFETADKCVTVGVLAKKLKQEGLPFGQNKLFKYMRDQGVLCSRQGKNFNTPNQRYMERGWFKVKATRIELSTGNKWEKLTLVTPKGVEEISRRVHELFNKEVFI